MSGSTPASGCAAVDAPLLQTLPRRQPSLRIPDPAKKVHVASDDDLHSAISAASARDEANRFRAVRGEAATAASAASITAASSASNHPPLSSSSSSASASASTSVPASPTKPMSPAVAVGRGADDRANMAQRTASIDSTVSSLSSLSQRPNGSGTARLSHEPSVPEDPASLIAAHGSAEAALSKVLADKQQAASHNAQLWRLVEKQRTMILGLNRDLERSLKEKERYRRKLKENLAPSVSAPALAAGTISREDSQSPALSDPSSDAAIKQATAVDLSAGSRKVSDSSDVPSVIPGRSDTPQDAPNFPSVSSTAPLSSVSNQAGATNIADTASTSNAQRPRPNPLALQTQPPRPLAVSTPVSPPMSAPSFSSPKQRKAPPAPLNLTPAPKLEPGVSSIVDASDSEYEEEPESARFEFVERGRRKTREDDDREREAQIRQEEEQQRSRSTKSKAAAVKPGTDSGAQAKDSTRPAANVAAEDRRPPASVFAATANPTDILRSRAADNIQRNNLPAALLSPGLPMSPRPGDRPMNAAMPRPPMTPSAMPMSPRSGMPLSPRPPTKPIPMPPQTPLGITSPHLDRAKTYQLQAQLPQSQSLASVVDRLKDENLEADGRASVLLDSMGGEIYRGLITEQYPTLLLPPHALASIFIKTASSRMKPSRASIIASKGLDELPVFTLGVHERSDNRQLWRVEKSFSSLAQLDQLVNLTAAVRDKVAMPDKSLFAGHAPVKVDSRRVALNQYFDKMLECVLEEKTAIAVCKFLSSDAIGAEPAQMLSPSSDPRPDTPVLRTRMSRAGYLTKRGKNFGGWKARYFVLDGPNLKYFEGPGGAHLGSIKLQNAQIGSQTNNDSSQQDEDNQFRHAFMILEPKKKDSSSIVRHVLCAESDAERDGWVDALLQYTDYKDGDDQPGRQGVAKPDFNPPKSPRTQKSLGEMRSTSNRDMTNGGSIGFGYNDAVAGDAPVFGSTPPAGNGTMAALERVASESSNLVISGPTNPKVIGNDWGMKPPPTPSGKDKKRSVFQLPFSRGRSSSEIVGPDNSKAASPAGTAPSPGGARAVFGIPLAEATEVARPVGVNVDMPAVVYRCIEYLIAKDAVAEEGIFRLSGSNTVIRALKDRFNVEGDVNLLADGEYHDIHAVASLLKLYLRELPSSILTRELHLDFLHCLETTGEGKIVELNSLVRQLPVVNRAVLEALAELLLMVVQNVAVNKMNVRNLGVVFAPTLNLPGPLISLLVEEQHRVFGPALSGTPSSELEPATSTSHPSITTNDASTPTELRSPRKQMFSNELSTPAYNQTTFPLPPGMSNPLDPADHSSTLSTATPAGMMPLRPSYPAYQMAPSGEAGFGSLNDLLRAAPPPPSVLGGTGVPTPRGAGIVPVPERNKRRESGSGASALGLGGGQRKGSWQGKSRE